MPLNFEETFLLPSGKRVFVQKKSSREEAKKICQEILSRWMPHRIFFHINRRGGHVAAMRLHIGNQYFAKIDISNFFGSVSRTKIARSLRSIGLNYKQAYNIAFDSVIHWQGDKFLPFGFYQSMILATLVLEKSAAGRFLMVESRVTISVYVDDIIISCNDQSILNDVYELLLKKLCEAKFNACQKKSQYSGVEVTSFNCTISKNSILINSDRMAKFELAWLQGSPYAKAGIEKYIKVLNQEQFISLTGVEGQE
jgi:hypothetical protein